MVRRLLSPKVSPCLLLVKPRALPSGHRFGAFRGLTRLSRSAGAFISQPRIAAGACHAVGRPDRGLLIRCVSDSRKTAPVESEPSVAKPIIEKTKEIRVQLRDRVSRNLVHENIYTLPNILTFSRLLATPVIGYLILHDAHAWATGLLVYAGLTDLVDGWIARRWKLQTVVGTVIDPMADKALMAVLTITLAMNGALPIWLATLIFGRDASLAIAAIYYRYASLPPPKTFLRYWNFSLPSAEVYPTTVSKVNTFLQLLLLGATTALPIAGPALDATLQSMNVTSLSAAGIMTAAQLTVATTTIWSGASYLWTRDAVKILGSGTPEQKKMILIKGRLIIGMSFLSCAGLALWLES